MRQRFVAIAVLACALSLGIGSAHAGGLEYQGAGAQALGRGGAVAARATDPMVIAYNPAGLAELRGSQFLLNMNLAVFDACVDPAGYYGWGVYLGGQNSILRDRASGQSRTLHLNDAQAAQEPYYKTPLDTVCLNQNVVPIPEIAWTWRISEKLGIGAGLIFPAVQPGGRWGGPNGIIHGADGTLRPAPTRYMMLASNNLGVFPNIAAGYRIFKALRLGAAFEWGVVAVNNYTMAGSNGGTIPANDIQAHIRAQDWFVPALTVSTQIVPIDAIDIVLSFRYQDDIHARGKIDLTSGLYNPAFFAYTTPDLKVSSLRQHMPWKLRAAVRYADRFAPRPVGNGKGESDPSLPDRVHDALQDERFDVELDAEYQMNARNDQQVLDYLPGQKILFAPADPNFMSMVPGHPHQSESDAPSQTVIQKHWRNQVSVSLGSTVNVLPGVIGISGGVNYETRGVDPSYMQIDFFPVSRVGLHGGVIFRVAKGIDLVASYGHIFQETIIAAPPEHQDRDVIAACWAGSAPDPSVCRAPTGQIGGIDKSTGPMVTRVAAPVLEAPSQGKADGTAKLQQNLTVTAGGQPPYIVNSGRYRSHFDVIAAGLNVHF
jgi:hypothetical protein